MTWVDILKEDTLEEKKKWFPFVFAFSGRGLTEKERRVGKGFCYEVVKVEVEVASVNRWA